jgi:Ca2+/H+ antiporter
MIIIYILFLAVGMFALIKGADIFVSGSSSIAKMFNVSSLIIGLTIVALGTSLPELAVSTSAALQGSNEIAISNVVGSNESVENEISIPSRGSASIWSVLYNLTGSRRIISVLSFSLSIRR